MPRMVCILLICCTLFGLTSAHASEGLGHYDGYRDVAAVDELKTLEARHFELLHAGKTAEAAALMKREIEPRRTSLEHLQCHFDTKIYTAMSPNQITVHLYFAPVSPKEGQDGGTDVFLIQMAPTLEEFEKIFEGRETFDRLPIDGLICDSFVTTRQVGNQRLITIFQTNKVDDETHKISKRQTCTIRMENGLITAIEVVKEKKPRVSLGGWRKTFSAKVIALRKSAQGLLLVDEGNMGRLQDRGRILRALADKSLDNFRNLLNEENR